MPEPGDVVTVDFLGAQGIKRRPAVVLSSAAYHRERPDVIVGVLTTNLGAARTSMDHLLRDWQQAGLRAPSAFRAYIGMALISSVRIIGKLSAHDWQEVRNCLKRAIG